MSDWIGGRNFNCTAHSSMMRYDSRPLLLFGATGRLGASIAEAARNAGRSVFCISWAETRAWRHRGDTPTIRSRFAEANTGAEIDVVFANGLTDPGQPFEELWYSNYEFPIQVIESMRDVPGMRFLTLGTVMERFPRLAEANQYVASKYALAARMSELAQEPCFLGRMLHLRLHTLYGKASAAHMFLGQIHASLQRGEPFQMSEGHQLREFHHVADVADSVLALVGRPWDLGATMDLNTARPVRLRTLAETLFSVFGRAHLLDIGLLETPIGENIEQVMPRSPEWLIGRARDPVEGIIEWLTNLLDRDRGCLREKPRFVDRNGSAETLE